MENSSTTRKWSELYELNVVVPSEGKTLGQVSDFYVKAGSNAIYALSVRTRLYGDLSLPITGIKAIEKERITLSNEQMLMKAQPHHMKGHALLQHKVVGENGDVVGQVKDVIIGVEPVVAMRVAGFEVVHAANDRHAHVFSADSVARYADDSVVVDDKTAKHLR